MSYESTHARSARGQGAGARVGDARPAETGEVERAPSRAPLLGLEERPPRWGSWHERFVFTAAFLFWADAARERPLSDYAFGAHGRQLLERHRAAFERDLVAVWSEHSPVQDWGAFVCRSVRSLAGWMERMA